MGDRERTVRRHGSRVPTFGRIRRSLSRIDLTAPRIALAYLVVGMGGLYVSDVLLVRYLSEPLLSQVQATKGVAEVLLTAGLIFALTRRSRRQVRQSAERVERQRDQLNLLHRVFRHNLRNDLNVIQRHASLVRDTEEDESTAAPCEQIVETVEKIEKYTEQARRIRRVAELDSRRRTFELSETVHRVLDDHVETDGATVRTTLPERARVRANPMFDEAIAELVRNALHHGGPDVTVAVDPERGPPATTEVRVEDDGSGLPESELEALRVDGDDQLNHSTGMGLWFVDWVVTHSDGEFVVRSDETGTTAVMRVPEPGAPLDGVPLPGTSRAAG